MQQRLTHYLLLIAVCLLTLLAGCKKEKNAGKIKIEGFHLTDPMGNELGHHGPADDDWTVKAGAGMPADIAVLFDFAPGVDMSEAREVTISQVGAYPNPANFSQAYFASASGNTLMKTVVVDRNLQVLDQRAALVKTGFNILTTEFSDRSKYPNKSAYRVYYSFSAPGKPNYLYGFGDILICESATGDCF